METSGQGPSVYLQYQLTGPRGQERLDLQSVVMRAGEAEALSGRVWRRIPFSEIEKALTLMLVQLPSNPPTPSMGEAAEQARQAFLSGGEAPAPVLEDLDEYFKATEADVSLHFNNLPSQMFVSDGADDHPGGRVPRIQPPDGRLTDDFLRDVADAYRWLTDAKLAPAPAIAEMAGVPVRTVHRWVYEARKRQILPPARTGRAG